MDVDLNNLQISRGFVIQGAAANDDTSYSISSVDDINGDRLADVIVGAFFASPLGRDQAGSSYVIYGKKGNFTDVDLAVLDATHRGLIIQGAAADDFSGYSVNSIGDIDGDGLTDLIVGAPFASPLGRDQAGSSYVIYGKSVNLTNIDLSNLTIDQGFIIQGATAGDTSGQSVNSAGDINGDGLTDLIVGAPYAFPLGKQSAGTSYIIYGQRSSLTNIDLSSLTIDQGFIIQGATAGDESGTLVSSAGDINGDGLTDLVVGAPYASPFKRVLAGSSYVIYGKKSNFTNIDLTTLTADQGFIIQGAAEKDYSGSSISAVGDINGDGLADLLIGAHSASPLNRYKAGNSYVIYGKLGNFANIDLSDLSDSQGFVIQGAAANDQSGSSVSSAGDINGDSLVDLLIGAPGASPLERYKAGNSYVVYGKLSNSADIDLNNLLSSQGFIIRGAAADDNSGFSVSSAGDINGDGLADLLIGAPVASPLGREQAGKGYVVYGINCSLDNSQYSQQSTQISVKDVSTTKDQGPIGKSQDVVNKKIDDILSISNSQTQFSWAMPFQWIKQGWQHLNNWLYLDNTPMTLSTSVQQLHNLKKQCQTLQAEAPVGVHSFYEHRLQEVIDNIDLRLKESREISSATVDKFVKQITYIKADFLNVASGAYSKNINPKSANQAQDNSLLSVSAATANLTLPTAANLTIGY